MGIQAVSSLQEGRRILLLERDLSQPDRIVGELLQPGGYQKLVALGLDRCVEFIDSQKVATAGTKLGPKKFSRLLSKAEIASFSFPCVRINSLIVFGMMQLKDTLIEYLLRKVDPDVVRYLLISLELLLQGISLLCVGIWLLHYQEWSGSQDMVSKRRCNWRSCGEKLSQWSICTKAQTSCRQMSNCHNAASNSQAFAEW